MNLKVVKFRPLFMLILILTLALAGCTADKKKIDSTPDTPSKTSKSKEKPPSETEKPAAKFKVYIFKGNRLQPLIRTAPYTVAVARTALEELIKLSSTINEEKDLPDMAMTLISSTSKITSLSVKDKVAMLNLSGGFFKPFVSAPTAEVNFSQALAQIIYTLTQFPGVDSVMLSTDKEVEKYLPEEVIQKLNKKYSRLHFSDFDPIASQSANIVVLSPTSNQEISNPLVISGKARVFEANLQVRLVGEGGKTLLRSFITADAGAPEWGIFSEQLTYDAATKQEGTLEVFTESAEDGRVDEIVSVPVSINP